MILEGIIYLVIITIFLIAILNKGKRINSGIENAENKEVEQAYKKERKKLNRMKFFAIVVIIAILIMIVIMISLSGNL